MRFHGQIIDGPHSGTDIVLEPHQRAIIGRGGNDVDIPLSSDRHLSRRHFALLFRDGAWWVQDLQSRNGLLHNDQPVHEATLQNDDLIQAGQTTVRISLHHTSPTPSLFEHSAARTLTRIGDSRARLQQALKLLQPRLYGLAAAALGRTTALLSLPYLPLPDAKQPYAYLLDLRQSTSALLALSEDEALCRALVFTTSPHDLAQLQTQLNTRLLPQTPDGKKFLLRLFDPSVLEDVMAACLPTQAQPIFGGSDGFLIMARDRRSLLGYTAGPDGVTRQVL